MAADEPPYLTIGTDVSAKYKGAFCEAKVKKVNRSVKCKVTFKNSLGTFMITDEQIRGSLRIGAEIEALHPEKKQYLEAVINKMQDYSQYTVVFDDGDETTLRRTSLCLKSGRHFAESPTLDQFPLTNPEHFGSPVLGRSKGKRKRRSTMNSATLDYYSSDEEVSPRKSRLARGKDKEKEKEKDPDVGKVVCVDYGDRRKKDNWYPGLIANTGSVALRINTKEEYLIRSFKDGKYYQVPKKDTREFNRDVNRRIENNSLKLAVEKAVLYTEKGVLPSQWAKTLYVGLETASNEEESHDTDSDSSDDEPSEEKDRFVAQLYKFMDERGTPINKTPTVGNKELSLYKLFKVVHKMHGYNRVTNQNKWKIIHGKMGFPATNPAGYNQIKQAYKRYLHSFEDFYRKLGCTMNSRATRGMHRSDRNFITTRNKSRDISSPKVQKDKDKGNDNKPEQRNRHNSEKKETKAKIESSPKTEDKLKSPEKKKPETKKADEKDDKTKVKKEEINKPRLVRSQSLNKDKKDIKDMDNTDEKKDTRHERARTREDAKREKTESPEKRKETRSTTKSEQEKKDKDDKKTESNVKDNSKKDDKLKPIKQEKIIEEKKDLYSSIKKYEKFPKVEKQLILEHIAFKEKKELKKEKAVDLKKEKIDIKVEKCDDSPTNKDKKDRLRDIKTNKFPSFVKTKPKEEKIEPEVSRERKISRDLNTLKDDNFVTILCDIKQEKDFGSDDEKDSHDHTSVSGPSGNDDDDFGIGKLSRNRRLPPPGGKEEIKSTEDISDESDEDVTETTDCKDKNIEVGDRVKVKYGRGRTQKVYEAKVLKIEIESNEKRFYVHYAGWNTRYDEWVRKTSIVENISEHNRAVRKQKKDTKDLPSPSKKNDRSRLSNVPSVPKLHRKNSTSSTNSSTISTSRTTRSDKSSLHSPQTSRGLQLRKRVCKKSFVSAFTDTSQDSESDEDSMMMDADDEDIDIENTIARKIKEEIVSSNEDDIEAEIEPSKKQIKKESDEILDTVCVKQESEAQGIQKIETKKYCFEGKKLRVELENCTVRLDKPSHITMKHLRQEKIQKNIATTDTSKEDLLKKQNIPEVKKEPIDKKEFLEQKTINEKDIKLEEKPIDNLENSTIKRNVIKEEKILKEISKEVNQDKERNLIKDNSSKEQASVSQDKERNLIKENSSKEQASLSQDKECKKVDISKQNALNKDREALKEKDTVKQEITHDKSDTKKELSKKGSYQIMSEQKIILCEQKKDLNMKEQTKKDLNMKEQNKKDLNMKEQNKKDLSKKLQEKKDFSNAEQEKRDLDKKENKNVFNLNQDLIKRNQDKKDFAKKDDENKSSSDSNDNGKLELNKKSFPISIDLSEKQNIPVKKEMMEKCLSLKNDLPDKTVPSNKVLPEKDIPDILIPVLKKVDETVKEKPQSISELIEKRYVELIEKQPPSTSDIETLQPKGEPKKLDEKMPRLLTYMSSYKDTSFSSNLSSPGSLPLFQSTPISSLSKSTDNKDKLRDLKAISSNLSTPVEKTTSSVTTQPKPNVDTPVRRRSYFPMFNFSSHNPNFTAPPVTSALEKKGPVKSLQNPSEVPLIHQNVAPKVTISDKPSISSIKIANKGSSTEEKKPVLSNLCGVSISPINSSSKVILPSDKCIPTTNVSLKQEIPDFQKQDTKAKNTDTKWKSSLLEDKAKISLEHNMPAICKSKPIEVRPKSPHFDKFSTSFPRPEKLKPVAPVSAPLVDTSKKSETNVTKSIDLKPLNTSVQRKTPTTDFDALKNLTYPKKELKSLPIKAEDKEASSYASVITFASSTVPNTIPPSLELSKAIKDESLPLTKTDESLPLTKIDGSLPLTKTDESLPLTKTDESLLLPKNTLNQDKNSSFEKSEIVKDKKNIAVLKEEEKFEIKEEKNILEPIDFGESIHKGLTELSIGEKGKVSPAEQNSSSNSSHGSVCNVFLNVSADKSGKDGKELFTPQKIAQDLKEEKNVPSSKNFSPIENAQNLSSLSIENVEKLTSSLEKESTGFLSLYKKEMKKKKSKGKKGLDSFDKEGKLREKLKYKKKSKFDFEDPSRLKDGELKSKTKKFKKNKNKKRFLKSDDLSSKLGESSSKSLFLEKIKKREKRKQEKKLLKTEENIDFKNELSKKEKKKGKKNKDKMSNDRKNESEKKIKKKKKCHTEENIDSDSDKESQIRLGEKKKKKDKKKVKPKDVSSSDDAAESRLLIDEDNATFTPVRDLSEKQEKVDDPDLSFLLCEEKVPASPVDVHSIPEDTTGSSSLDNSNNRSPSSDEDRIRPVNLDAYPPRSANIEMLNAVNKRNVEASAVLDNTPPTTPSSSPSSMPSSSPSHDREPFLHYTESTQSGRESCEREMDTFHSALNRTDGIESEEYRAAATLAFAVCQSVTEKSDSYRTPPLKRQKSELDEFSPSKRRKKKSDIPKVSTPKYKAASRSPRGESCDTYDSSNASILTAGSPPHGSSLSHFSSFSHHSSQMLNPAESTSCTKSSKHNFYIPLHEYKDPEKRISILQDKMTELKKVYASLKAEVAMIDRRRKKARKKIREAAAASGANNTPAHGDDGDNCS